MGWEINRLFQGLRKSDFLSSNNLRKSDFLRSFLFHHYLFVARPAICAVPGYLCAAIFTGVLAELLEFFQLMLFTTGIAEFKIPFDHRAAFSAVAHVFIFLF